MRSESPIINLRQPYEQRSVRFLETWQIDDWVLKVYGIAYRGDVPREQTVAAARPIAADALPRPARSDERYGVGFVIVHEGQDACWLLIDWWGFESVLHHRLFMSELDGEAKFVAAPPFMTACVWELPVLTFERDAWVETVLSRPDDPDVAGYLRLKLNGRV